MAKFLPALLKLRQDPFRFLKSLGFTRANKAIWDTEYSSGHWDYLDQEGAQVLTLLITKYSRSGRILDLGCGTTRNLELDPESYSHYLGIDISAEAIERARAVGRPNSDYEVAEVLSYYPDRKFDIILLKEVLPYLPVRRVVPLIERLASSLSPDGVIIVQIWNLKIYRRLVAKIRGCSLPVLQELEHMPGGITLVLAGRTS